MTALAIRKPPDKVRCAVNRQQWGKHDIFDKRFGTTLVDAFNGRQLDIGSDPRLGAITR